MDTNADRSAFERHAQTIISSLLLLMLSWSGVTLLDVRDRLTRIEAMKIGEAEANAQVRNSIADLQQRVRALEMRQPR